MKSIFILSALLFSFNGLHAQKDTTVYGYIDSNTFMQAEIPPAFPGGPANWIKYLQHNLNYPEEAKAKHIQGTVIVQFVVSAEGENKDITVVQSVDPGLDKEALRLIKNSKWVPAIQFGRPANYRKRQEIIFSL